MFLSEERHVQTLFVRNAGGGKVNVDLVLLFRAFCCDVPLRHKNPLDNLRGLYITTNQILFLWQAIRHDRVYSLVILSKTLSLKYGGVSHIGHTKPIVEGNLVDFSGRYNKHTSTDASSGRKKTTFKVVFLELFYAAGGG